MITVEVEKKTLKEVNISFDDKGAELLLDTLSFCKEKKSDVDLYGKGGGDELDCKNLSGSEYLVAFRLWFFQDRPSYNRLKGGESELTIELFLNSEGKIDDFGVVLILSDAGNEKIVSLLKKLVTSGGSKIIYCDRAFHRILPIQRETETVKSVENITLRFVYVGANVKELSE